MPVPFFLSRMNSDYFYSKGSSHVLCQDFAAKTRIGKIEAVAVCDGCSSSPASEIGAALLCQIGLACAAKYFDLVTSNQRYEIVLTHQILQKMRAFETDFNLRDGNFDATLLLLAANKETRKGFIFVAGDGAFHLKTENQDVFVECSFVQGAPRYLSYDLNEERRKLFKTEYSEKVSLKTHPNNSVTDFDSPLFVSFENLVQATVFSDGIFSFGKQDAHLGFLKYKSFSGDFVKRRARAEMASLAKEGFVNYDDYSQASILAQ